MSQRPRLERGATATRTTMCGWTDSRRETERTQTIRDSGAHFYTHIAMPVRSQCVDGYAYGCPVYKYVWGGGTAAAP